ncbi:MAG TPA: carboxypeptidase-like regulatory domain-containing protein, partial [Vicinamibacterales bacterium]
AAASVGFPNIQAPPPGANFAGLDYANWGAGHPPDTNGDVGPTYYIQTINTSIGIFDKSNGNRVAAFTFNSFMSQGNFGNLCDTDNFGDPVVVYDSFEDRWIITDFAFKLDASQNVINPPGSFQCFAVSMNGDPVSGGWNYYSINTTGGLGDYPKFGIWPDGLYMSANMFDYAASGSFQDTRLYAFNKAQMYAGSPTVKVVSFDLPTTQFTVLPANARLQTGTPPSGSPNYFASVWQFLNSMQIWKFHVDWNNIPLSSVTGPFDTTMTFWWEQFNRSSTSTAPTPANFLDTLYPRLMVQNQYSRIGGVESLWTSHTVGAGNPTSNLTSAQSAIRYYQVNVTGGSVAATTPQSWTYSPDATIYRYMPSVAVNRAGDMAIGYTTSNATTNPGIKYAGRLAGDAANSITLTEQLLFQGTGSQSGTCGGTCTRWGDYSAMTLDPDGCTFWYTNEYYAANGLAFLTRIGSFIYPSCTKVGAGGTIAGTVTATSGGAPISGAIVTLGSRTTTADASGNYSFNAIPAGTYPTLTASYPGYTASSVSSVPVTDGGTTTRNFSLNGGSSGSCAVDTTQADFNAGVQTNVDVTTTPGNVVLAKPDLLDQSNSNVTASGFGISTTSWAGQTFTPAISGKLVRADIELFCNGCSTNSSNVTVSIRATTGATPVPTGADLATATLPGFNDGGAGGLKSVTFASPLTVTAGTRYAVIFRIAATFTPGSIAYTCSCGSSNYNPYASGQLVKSANSGSTWSADTTAGGRDLNFRIYVNAGYSTSGNLISSTKDGNPTVG